MTHPLTIQSPFQDVTELVDGLTPFFTGEHLVLRAPEDVPEGEWIRFEVLLVDGTPGLAGLGQHAGTNDNGEEFAAERFDIYLGELQVDEGAPSEAWERILLGFEASQGAADAEGGDAAELGAEAGEEPAADAGAAGDDASVEAAGDDAAADDAAQAAAAFDAGAEDAAGPAVFDADAEDESLDADAEDESLEAGAEDASGDTAAFDLGALGVAAVADDAVDDIGADVADAAAEDAGEWADAGEASIEADASDAELGLAEPVEAIESLAAPVPPAPTPSRVVPDVSKAPAARPAPTASPRGPLGRPTLAASWTPAAEPPVARPSLGVFAWGDRGLPVPARPPRPAGEARRIDPAPRPAGA